MAVRTEFELYPSFSAEIEEIRKNGISAELISKIIQKHQPNSLYNKALYKRYMAIRGGVPIFDRQPRYEEENPINNTINNDYMGLIVNAKTGCFAGYPISYSYSKTKEAEEDTGGEIELEQSTRVLTDFVTRNNMHKVDIQTTKNAAAYGYSGRLGYIDKEGNERVMPVHGFETIILSDVDICEPEFAIRYYEVSDIDNTKSWVAEFYDNKYKTTFKGDLLSLQETDKKPHLFDYCPLQGIPNNLECMGDAEKVISLIDDYDKVVSDNSNELEAFVHALMQISVNIEDDKIKAAQKSGVIVIPQVGSNPVSEPVKWVTKNINDTFSEHHLEKVENNIYAFSQTPNFNDDSFGNASGVSLEHKFNGMREKCTTFKANHISANTYMWKVLCSSWEKKGFKIDPLHIVSDVKFNIPQDIETEARVVQILKGAGLPDRYVYAKLSDVEDVEWILDEIQAEKEDVTSLYGDIDQDTPNKDDGIDENLNDNLDNAKTGEQKIQLLNGAQITALTGIVSNVKNGVLSRNAAITMAVTTLGISRENAEAIIEEKI